ncbi:MAG: CapA family protein [Clostridiales bacterium]|nr:CapA family protein [Clostridiales bacterium]
MKKRIPLRGAALLLALALLPGLTACGQSGAEESSLPAASSSGAPAEQTASDADGEGESRLLSPEESDPEPEAASVTDGEASSDMDGEGDASLLTPEESDTEPETPDPDPDTAYEYTLCFAGDVNLAEGQYTTAALDAYGVSGCVSETLRSYMTGADIMCLNNEFTFSTRGSPLSGKTYTYRANPSRVSVLESLGVDIAVLANNHIYDYGADALLDTLDTLDNAGIARIGAGQNLEEASAIYYAELENCTVAYIAASRVEWSAQTQPATSDRPGTFYTAYDTDLLYQRVQEAGEHADFVVVYMHWGIEGTSSLEEYQVEVGAALVDAGADLVIGDHPHQLQGVHYYNDVPIFYSLGNYWFSRKEEYTMLVNVTLKGDKNGVREVAYQIVPAYQQASATVTWLENPDSQRAMYDYLEGLPGSNITVDDDGMMTES